MLLENLFSNVLDMSITASYVAIAVIVIRFIIKKAPKSFSFAIWIPVLFRLVCPISFISNLSVFNFINRDSFRKIEGVSQSITVNNTISNIRSGQVSDNIAGNAVTNIANNTTISQGIGNNFMYLVSILWMIGIQILIVYFIVSYIKTYSRIKTATLYNENVYESDQIDTAFVFGLIKPKIYIPVNLTESEKIYIIEHEKVHIKRKDYVTKIIAFLILIIHWFNPIMWISFILMTRDMEMSCDERVMKNLGEDIKTNYSYSLLNLAVNKGNTFNIPLSFSENNIKSRIENVLNYKKPKKWFILIIALAIVASTVFLISNPKNNDVDNSKSLIQNIQTLKEESQNRNVLIKNIGDITDFKWDYVYSFEPYTSKENIEKASELIREAAAQGAQVILPPELFERPYFCQERRYEYYGYARTPEEDDAVIHMKKLAKELETVIPVSFYEAGDHRQMFNSVAVIDADGSVCGIYRKTHIPDDHYYQEKFYFTPGDTGFRAFKTRYGTIGVGICWDQWFPETARGLALKGAELLFYPTAIGSEPILGCDSMPHWRRCMMGHAACNLMPVIAANRIGTETVEPCAENGQQSSALTFYGSSFITDATGEVTEEMDRVSEGFILHTFDLDEIEEERRSWGLFRDRRPEIYLKE